MKRNTQPATRNLGRSILALAVTMLTALSAHAAYWDTNGTTAGAGTNPDGTWSTAVANWNTDANGGAAGTISTWSYNVSPVFSAGDDAETATITVQDTVYTGNILFEEGSYTMVGTGTNPSVEMAWWAGLFTVDSGASVLFDSSLPVTLRDESDGSNKIWDINGEARFGGTVTAWDNSIEIFRKTGTGTLVFDGDVGATGNFIQVEVNGGTTIVNGSWNNIERVWAWGTLGGNGSISASQDVNFNGGGTIAPGDSTADRIGTFNVTTPSFNLANHAVGGGNVNLEVGTTADKLDVTGALSVSNNATKATANVTNLGGIGITQASSYTLIEADSGTGMDNYLDVNVDAPWEVTSKTTTELVISLDASQDRGNFNVTGAFTEFDLVSPQATGYIDLLGMQTETAYGLYLDIAGGTLSNLTDQLTADGITWSTGTGEYELLLSLNSGTTTTEYLVWDFSDIDGSMTLAGFALIPEPTSFALLGLGVLALMRRPRRRRTA